MWSKSRVLTFYLVGSGKTFCQYTGVKRPRTPSFEEPALSESRYVTIENSKTLHESPLIHPRTPKVARFLRILE